MAPLLTDTAFVCLVTLFFVVSAPIWARPLAELLRFTGWLSGSFFRRALHAIVDKLVDAAIVAFVLIFVFDHPWPTAISRAFEHFFG